MKWYNPLTWGRKSGESSLDRLIRQSMFLQNTVSGILINPKTAMQSPTVFAIVNRMSRAIASTPFSMYRDESEPGRRKVPKVPDHNITVLLSKRPNQIQTASATASSTAGR